MQNTIRFSILLSVLLFVFSCDSEKDKAGRFFLMGNEAMQELNYKEAIRLYTEAIAKDPQLKEAFNNRGVAFFKTLHYAEAINDYTFSIVQIDPDYIDPYKNRFEASLASGHYERALEDAEFLNKTFPDSAYTYFYKGLALTDLKQYNEAIEQFQLAFEKDPNDVEAVVNQANAHYMAGQLEEAKKLLNKAVGIDATEPNIYNTLALIATQEKDYEEALKQVNEAIELDRLNPYFNNNRGFIYLSLGEIEKAEADINLGIKSDPRNPWAYRNKAIFYHLNKNNDAALRNIEQAALYDDSIPLLNYYWGSILIAQGKTEEACAKLSLSAEADEPEGKRLFEQHCK